MRSGEISRHSRLRQGDLKTLELPLLRALTFTCAIDSDGSHKRQLSQAAAELRKKLFLGEQLAAGIHLQNLQGLEVAA